MNSNRAIFSSHDSSIAFSGGGGRAGGKGIFMTVPRIVAALVVFVISLVAVGLIVYFAVPKAEPAVTAPPPTSAAPTETSTATMAPTATTEPQPDTDYRLPIVVKPDHYNLILAPFFYNNSKSSSFYFTGSVTIYARAVQDSVSEFKLHRHQSMQVPSMKIMKKADNSTISFIQSYDEKKQWLTIKLSTSLSMNESFVILIEKFRAPLRTDLRGLYLSEFKSNGTTKYLATSQLQPTDARKTFPCFDEPTFKATFDVSIVRRKEFVSISNMPTVKNSTVKPADWFDESDTDGDWQMESYQTTPIMSSYLLAFIVSEFDYIEDTDATGRLYRSWMRPEFKSLANYSMEAGINITNFFETYYNVGYPLNKTDQAAVPDFNAGAMENWGLIIYRETRLLYDDQRDTSSVKQAIGNVISHELAHMWYGNLVTADWWDDIWLNEGFASFTQHLGVDQLHPDWEIDAQFVTTQQASAFSVDSKGSSRPIYKKEVYSPSEISAMFDTITYRKGASVLRQMYYFLGEENFKVGIGKYLREYSYVNAQHPQLFKIMQEQAEASKLIVNVTEVMNRYILQMGFPFVTVNRTGNNKLTLTQQHFLSDDNQKPGPSPYNYVWHIPITMADDKTMADWTRENVKTKISEEVQWMKEKSQDFSLKNPSQKWYLLNVWSAGFYRINYDSENWKALTKQLLDDHTVFSPHDRARMIEDSFSLAAAGKISYDIPLNITQYLKNEKHYVPWSAALSQLAYVRSMLFRNDALYGQFSGYMRRLLEPAYKSVGINRTESYSHLNKLKQGLIVRAACQYGLEDCRTEAQKMFEAYRTSNFTSIINPDVRSRVLCDGVAAVTAEQWDSLFEHMGREQHVGTQNDILRALACSKEPWVLTRYLTYALDPTKVRLQDASTVFSSVAANSNGLQIVWDYLQSSWDEIVDKTPGSFTTSYFVANLGAFNTENKKEEMIRFRDANREKLGSAARAMELAIDTVNTNINWMKNNKRTVETWLTAFA